ncbi:MAG: nascent polypeptide-associated complex protein [Candidatus Marsarchaeota archaeon]|nr:nascent polypeptide-associated complex protein [Candidatus Marsarchaeota archaeon]
MLPNMDIKSMGKMLAKMGIKTDEINANRVLIECNDKTIIVEEPQVVKIIGQGIESFQVSGNIKEVESNIQVEITDDDIKLVASKANVSEDEAKVALEESKGDIAEALLKFKKE